MCKLLASSSVLFSAVDPQTRWIKNHSVPFPSVSVWLVRGLCEMWFLQPVSGRTCAKKTEVMEQAWSERESKHRRVLVLAFNQHRSLHVNTAGQV